MKNFSLLFLFICHCFAYSQQLTIKKYSVQRATLTFVGSTTVYTNNNKYNIQQSIGQTGIIGIKKVKLITVQEGFLNNNISLKLDNTNKNFFKETLDFVISPNPFIDYIKIDFAKKTTHNVYIRIFDINGKVHANKKYNPTDKILISMKNYSLGTYLIEIQSGKISSTNKILKAE